MISTCIYIYNMIIYSYKVYVMPMYEKIPEMLHYMAE